MAVRLVLRAHEPRQRSWRSSSANGCLHRSSLFVCSTGASHPGVEIKFARWNRFSGLRSVTAARKASSLFQARTPRRIAEIEHDQRPTSSGSVMGFVVGIHRWPSNAPLVDSALRDTAEVTFIWGCDIMGEKVSVARLVAEEASLIDEAVIPLRRKKPNKAPEPTPRPVMIPAEPGITPGRVVAVMRNV